MKPLQVILFVWLGLSGIDHTLAAVIDRTGVAGFQIIAFKGSHSTPDGIYLMINGSQVRLFNSGDENSSNFTELILARDLLAALAAAGRPVTLPTPISATVLKNASSAARQELSQYPAAQALFARSLEARLYNYQERNRDCLSRLQDQQGAAASAKSVETRR